MANRQPLEYPRFQAFDDDGTPLSGGEVTFYDAGTTTKRDVYSDASLSTTAPNPVTLNSRGEPQSSGGTAIDIYLDSQPYKIVTKRSDGTTVRTTDNYIATQTITEPEDPADATDQSTDVYEGVLNRDPASGEIFQLDFQTANGTTTPTFENTGGTLGALTIKTRDGSALWANAINGEHSLYYDGTDYLLLDPIFGQGVTGADNNVVTGTAGTNGNLVQWNVDGDAVDGPGKTGADANVVTGTAGTSGNIAQWNADGDAVDSGVATSEIGAKAQIDTGTYTGDGTTSQSITGVGFQPSIVYIHHNAGDGVIVNYFVRMDSATNTIRVAGSSSGDNTTDANSVISLDADGFTVDDGGSDLDPNQNGRSYSYTAIG